MTDGEMPRRERIPIASRPTAPETYGFPADLEGTLPWSHVEERLLRAQNYWLATVRPDGRPHVTPVWGAWVDDTLYFDGLPTTRWGRNLAANREIAFHLESGEDVVILEVTVEDVTTDGATTERVVAAWNEKYGELAPEPATRGVFRLRPRIVRAWSQYPKDVTRWTFEERRCD